MSDNALDQLSQIAPVVPIGIRGPQRADWQGRAELVADVVNAQDVLADLEEQYAHRAEQIATQYADVLDEHTFNVLDSYEAGTVIPYGPTSMIGNILGPAGATFAPSASSDVVTQIDQSPSQNVSVERLGELTDGTAILYGARSSDLEPSTAQQALLDNEILQRSAAARAGHLYPIGKTTIAGYGDALACLDQFEAALTTLRQ